MKYIFLIFSFYLTCAPCKAQNIETGKIVEQIISFEDSILYYANMGKYDNALQFCHKGVDFYIENQLNQTPDFASLCLKAGEISIKCQDYDSAQRFFLQGFILDKLGEMGLGAFEQIEQVSADLPGVYFFVQLLAIANHDEDFLIELVENPEKLSEKMNTIALENKRKGEYALAIRFFEFELCILDIIGKTANDVYMSVIPLEIQCFEALNELDKAFSAAEYFMALAAAYYGENTLQYATAMTWKAKEASELEEYAEALSIYDDALSLYESIIGKESIDYIRCLSSMASVYQRRDGNVVKLVELQELAVELVEKASDATVADKAHYSSCLANSYSILKDWEKYLQYAQRAQRYFEDGGETNTIDYASALSTTSTALVVFNRYQEAIELQTKSIEIYAKLATTPEQITLHKLAISNLSYCYFEAGDIDKAIEILTELLATDYSDPRIKLIHLQRLVVYYQRINDTDKMKKVCEEMLSMAELLEGKNSQLYADALMFASPMQSKTGDQIMMLQEAIQIYENVNGKDSDNYLAAMRALSRTTFRTNADLYSDSQSQVLQELKTLYGEYSPRFYDAYFDYLSRLADAYSDDFAMDKMIRLKDEVDIIMAQIETDFGHEHEMYRKGESLMATIYQEMFRQSYEQEYIDKCISHLQKICDYSRTAYGEENIKYIQTLERLAHAHSMYFAYFDKACNLQRQIVDYYALHYGKEHMCYADAISTLATYYYKDASESLALFRAFGESELSIHNSKNYQENIHPKLCEGITLANEALRILESNEDKVECSRMLLYLNWMYSEIGDFQTSSDCYLESFYMWREAELNELNMLTSAEKEEKINNANWYSTIRSYTTAAVYKDNNYPKLNETAYNAQLFQKGILLSSEVGLRELIARADDPQCQQLASQMTAIYSRLLQAGPDEDIRPMRLEYQSLERELMKRSQDYGDYMHNMKISFDDVRASLNPHDLAIEFLTVPTIRDDGNWGEDYFALTVASDYTFPRITRLCADTELLSNDSLYTHIWQPLAEELKDKKNIYFAPTSILHKKPLESAELLEKGNTGNSFHYYRLTSTRQLAYHKSQIAISGATIYGGLEYDAQADVLSENSRKYRISEKLQTDKDASMSIASRLRGANDVEGYPYLPATLTEVQKVSATISKAKLSTTLLVGNEGTETSIKKLNGTNCQVLHIATHGFYVPDNTSPPLQNSGLLFAGCNNILDGVELPEGVDDGILFAKEIAALNLRGLQLVTLSACETGLGDVSGEGVSGLQRAFKLAGAESILMSLWPVDDEATCRLMTEFYTNWIARKMTKHDALEAAKRTIRETKGWEDPKYWAAFILLDGLD